MAEPRRLYGQNIVNILREALERAERGEFVAVALAYETSDDGIGHRLAFTKGASPSALVGELHLAMMSVHIETGRLKTPSEDT